MAETHKSELSDSETDTANSEHIFTNRSHRLPGTLKQTPEYIVQDFPDLVGQIEEVWPSLEWLYKTRFKVKTPNTPSCL